MIDTSTTLLEHLAGFSWFARHGEVPLISGMAVGLNKHPAVAAAVVELLRQRSGLDVTSVGQWRIEQRQAPRTVCCPQ